MGKKRSRCIALVLVVGMLAAACGKKETAGTEDSTEKSSGGNVGMSQTPAPEDGGEGESGAGTESQPETPTEGDPGNGGATSAGRGIRLLHPLINSQYKDYYSDSGDRHLVSVSWDTIEFEEAEEREFPELAAAVREQFKKDEEEVLKDAKGSRNDAEDYLNNPDAPEQDGFSFAREVELQRCDSDVFSFVVRDYQFTGGAHGNYGCGAYSYDAKTGKLLQMEDLFADRRSLAEAVTETLISMYSPDEFYDVEGLPESVAQYIDNGSLNVALTNRGARVYFNPYELGPYAAGVLIVDLYPEYYPDLLAPEYARTSENWIVRLPKDENLHVDVDGDDLPEDIRYSERLEYEEGWMDARIVGFDIYAGTAELFLPIDVYSSEGYFVRDEGRSYLYLFCQSDNDYQLLEVIDLTDKKMWYEQDGSSFNAAVAAKDWGYEDGRKVTGGHSRFYSLTDPKEMHFESRTDYLSTVGGVRIMHVGENGAPVPNEGQEYYRIDRIRWELKALKDVEGTAIDEQGNEAGACTIPAGSTVTYIMTDNETFGDVMTADGTRVRLFMKRDSWPYTIGGTPLEELFDGILFAG